MDFGYARVSVREPESRNLNLQIEQLVRVGISLDSIYSEEASGANRDRAELLKLLAVMETGDVLVVTHLDRLSRNLTHGLGVIESLHERGVNFRSLNEEMDTTTPNGKLQLAMVLAFSQWYRDSIRERSIAGQLRARGQGRHPGRPMALSAEQVVVCQTLGAEGLSFKAIARIVGVSAPTVKAALES